jgi:glycosyltransferase involved in cell wall biosynthesis
MAIEPRKLLIYEPYPFGTEGGNLRTLRYLLGRGNRDRLDVLLVVPFETSFTDKMKAEGVSVSVVAPSKRVNRYGGEALRDSAFGRLLTGWDLVRYNMRVRRVIRAESVDVIYANCIRAVLYTMLAGLVSRTPILWYVKGELGNRVLDTLGFIVSSRILFFCEANRDDRYPRLVSLYRKKIGVLEIGIDLDEVDAVKQADHTQLCQELDVRSENLNVIILGQLYRPKGVDLLIRAFGELAKERASVRLYIVGDPVLEEYQPYKAELVAMVEGLGLQERVVFTGWRPDALAILSTMDVLVHPSLSEGFGRAVLEAMALGKPVCASRVGGLRESIRDGENGFSIPPGDVEALTDRLGRLLDDADLRARFGKAAHATVEARFLIDEKVSQFEDFALELAEERRAEN